MTVSRNGFLLLNKKSGDTSFDSLKTVKKVFGTGKVGHTGTLDKFASGLLVVLVGRGVKLAPLFSGCIKEYIGTVSFGAETDTLDPEGAVIARGPVPSLLQIEAALAAFRGDILQSPPAYSAVHINGRRAHELVREGQEPEMKRRPVTVYSLEILSWAPPDAVIQVRCSAGTYIRSLARDIALAADSRAYLSALKRTRVGAFRLEDSVEGDSGNLVDALRPLDRKLFGALSLPYFLIDEKAAESFTHGKPLRELLAQAALNTEAAGGSVETAGSEAPAAGVFRQENPRDFLKNTPGESGSPADKLLGVLERRNGAWSYGHVFADN